jgi:predicted transcriptional regulator
VIGYPRFAAIGDNICANIPAVTMTLSITIDDELGRDLASAVNGGNRSAVVAAAIREYLDRRNIAAAAAWHASLEGDDAAALADFDASW